MENGLRKKGQHFLPQNLGYNLTEHALDLVGGPFAVIESDPDVFTTLIREIGIEGVEVEEMYDVEPWTFDHIQPKGLILCFTWKLDKHHPDDFLDPAAKDVWFANQLSDDACASLAILNVLFNCPGVELGGDLETFKKDTIDMSPKMKGLAISNLRLLRDAQNSLARPVDLRGSLSAIAEATQNASALAKKPVNKPAKTTNRGNGTKERSTKCKSKKSATDDDDLESYHFIGYVPAHGKVWELDGLKSGPLEVGELPSPESTSGWEDVVRPALRLKMERYGATATGNIDSNIRFSLLALVQDRYEVKSDELELLKRERVYIERKLKDIHGESWTDLVDRDLLNDSSRIFSTAVQSSSNGPVFAKDFGSRKMQKELMILQTPSESLLEAWETCVTSAVTAKVTVDEEIAKAHKAKSETLKRTHDYEPFIQEYLIALHNEGLLADLL